MAKFIYLVCCIIAVTYSCLSSANSNSKQAATLNLLDYQPETVLVYSKAFAQRLGLDATSAIDLDPGIYAISITFDKTYHFLFLNDYDIIAKLKLKQLTPEQADTFRKHLEVLPILFKNSRLPLTVSYQCNLNLYLNNEDARVNNIRLPRVRIWSLNTDGEYLHTIEKQFARSIIKPSLDKNYLPAISIKKAGKNFSFFSYIDDYLKLDLAEAVLATSRKELISGSNSVYVPLNYSSHFKNILPGVTYLSFVSPTCSSIRAAGDRTGTMLWLEKQEGPDYVDNQAAGTKYDIKDFYKFKIPREITNAITLENIAKLNQRLSKTEFKEIIFKRSQ